MCLLDVFFLFSILLCTTLIYSLNVQDFNIQHKSLETYNRHQRDTQTGTQKTSIQSEVNKSCAINCIIQYTSTVHFFPGIDNIIEQTEKTLFTLLTSLTQSQFKTYCNNILIPISNCFSKCPSSTLTKLLWQALEPGRYLCVDHFKDIYDSYECFQQAQSQFEEDCDELNCKNLNQAPFILLRDGKGAAKNHEYEKLQLLFANNCDYHICSIPCKAQIIAGFCGAQIADITQTDLISISLQSSKEILSGVKQFNWPKQCDRVQQVIEETKAKGYKKNPTGIASSIRSRIFVLVFLVVLQVLFTLSVSQFV